MKEAIEYIKTIVPKDKEQREIYVRNINTYLNQTPDYNYDESHE